MPQVEVPMDASDRKSPDPAIETKAERRLYEPPRIVWREPYEPVAFGISCATNPGQPGCDPGPFTT
jgi:hypothetical protein